MSLRDMAKIVRNLELYKNKNNQNNLTNLEYEVIRYISKSKKGVTNKELSSYLYIDKALVSRTVKGLIQKDYLFTETSFLDARSKNIYITKKALMFKNETINLEKLYFREVTTCLTKEEKDVFYSLLKKIYTKSKNKRVGDKLE